jgi:hypothetical protein
MNAATIVIAVMVIAPTLLLVVDLVRSRAGSERVVQQASDDLALAAQVDSGVAHRDQLDGRGPEQVGERRRIGEGEMRRAGQLEQRTWPAQARRDPLQRGRRLELRSRFEN